MSFGDPAQYDANAADPTDAAGEARLAWYLEEHTQYRFLDTDLEQEAVQRIAAYGEALFAQVFGRAVSYDYRRLQGGFDGCQRRSARAAPAALGDDAGPGPARPTGGPSDGHPRVDALGSKFDPPGGPTLNILVMVARPDGPADVGYRTISRPPQDTHPATNQHHVEAAGESAGRSLNRVSRVA